jgi:hypothetical protein
MQTVEKRQKLNTKGNDNQIRAIFSRDFKDYLDSNKFLSVKAILRHM